MADVLESPADAGFYDLAPVYDFVYRRDIDYERQAERVREAATDRSVLELACGTGRLAERLVDDYEYVGVDASPSMLAVARRTVDDAALVRADARRVAFDRRFGAVAMLGRSTAHFGRDDLLSAAEVAHEHLGGGVVLDAHDRTAFVDSYTNEDRYESDRWTVVYRGESTATGGGWCR